MGENVLWELGADGSSTMAVLDEIDAGVTAVGDSISAMAATASDSFAQLDAMWAELAAMTQESAAAAAELDTAAATAAASVGEEAAALDAMATAAQTAAAAETEVAAAADAVAAQSTMMGDAMAASAGMVSGAWSAIQGPLMMVGMAAAMVGAKLVQAGMQGQESFTRAQSMAGASDADMQKLSQTALQLGVDMKDAGDGFYYVESAGYKGKDAITVFTDATKAAKAGGANFSDVASGLTAVMHAYGDKANKAGIDTDMMVKAVVQGKQSFQDYASAIGPLAAIAHNTGISFAEVNAAEATMTQINPHVRQDANQLQHLFQAVGLNADAVAASVKKMGLHFNESTYKSDNLLQKLQYLQTVTKGNKSEFEKLVGGTSGYQAALDLLSGKTKTYSDNLKAEQNAAGSTDAAYKKSESTMTAAMQHIGAAFSYVGMKIVEAASKNPQLMNGLKGIAAAATNMGNNIGPVINNVIGAFSTLATWVGNVSSFFSHNAVAGTAMKVALIAVAGAIGGILVIAFAAWAIAAGAAAIATIAATWPILAIGAAIALVVAGIILAVQHWGDIMGWITGQTALAAVKNKEHFEQMKIDADTKTIESAQKSVKNLTKEREGIIEQLKLCKNEAERHRLEMKLKAIDHAIRTKEATIQAALEEKRERLKHLAELKAQEEEARKNIFQHAWDAISGFFGKVFSALGTWAHGIVDWLGKLKDEAIQKVQDMINGIIQWWATLFLQTDLKITDIGNTITNFFTSLPGKAVQWMADFGQKIIDGLNNLIPGVGTAVSKIAGKIASFLHFSKPDTGPLSDADQWMPHMTTLLEQGLQQQAQRLGKASLNVATNIAGAQAPSGASLNGGGMTTALLQQLVQQGQSRLQVGPQPSNAAYGVVNQSIGSIQFNGQGGLNNLSQNDLLTLYQIFNRMSGFSSATGQFRGVVNGAY